MNPLDLAVVRFKPIRQAQERLARAQKAHAEAVARVERLRAELPQAEADDRRLRGDAIVDRKSPPASKASRIRAELEAAEQQQADLEDAVARAVSEVPKVIAANKGWYAASLRELVKARMRYQLAIAELAAARDACSSEAALAVWLSTEGRATADAANDVLGGRLGAKQGQAQPFSFGAVLEELRADAEHLAAHPASHDDPRPRPDLSLIRRAS